MKEDQRTLHYAPNTTPQNNKPHRGFGKNNKPRINLFRAYFLNPEKSVEKSVEIVSKMMKKHDLFLAVEIRKVGGRKKSVQNFGVQSIEIRKVGRKTCRTFWRQKCRNQKSWKKKTEHFGIKRVEINKCVVSCFLSAGSLKGFPAIHSIQKNSLSDTYFENKNDKTQAGSFLFSIFKQDSN